MHKTATIRNYNADTTEVVIEEFENVSAIFVCVISGDEVLNVIYKDGRTERFDSSNDRITDYYDGGYNVPLDKLDEFSNCDKAFINLYRFYRFGLGDEQNAD